MSLNTPVFLKEREEDTSKFVEIQQSQTTCIAAEDPLQNLCLASQDVLKNAQQNGRSKCLKCGGSRMFYCYTCYVPVENVPVEQIPHVKLPLKIDIIKHPNETDGKSTAVHAKLLAPEFVNIYTYPCIPEYEEKDHEVALVFPGPKSVSVKDISFHLQKKSQNSIRGKNDDLDKPSIKRKKTEEPDLNDSKCKDTTLKKIVFIDSTWNQTNKIFTDERLQVVMFGCESWTIKKTECQRIDAFELWCWRLLRFPWTARRSKQSILIIILIIKEINPEYALELLILKLKFQYLGHLMRRADLLVKILMLGKIEGKRRRGQRRMRWLDGIINSMNMNLSKPHEIVNDREAWHAAVHGVTKRLLQVELKTRKTCFWRHQKGKPDTFLSTIEAIYYFLVDYHTDILKEKYKGQYDNLLFFYSFMHQLIKNAKCPGDKETRKLTH